MAKRQNLTTQEKRIRKKRRILIIEIIILLAVAAAALGSGWLNKKLNLINFHKTDDDKLVTASEANALPAEVANLDGKDMIALVGIDTREDMGAQNSDTMIITLIDHDEKKIKMVSLYRDTYLNIGDDKYTKCNAAYNVGGPEQMLSMMNLNMDLNLTEFVTVEFQAVADTIDLLGGVDIELSRAEMENINFINIHTSEVTGYPYVEIPVPSEEEMGDDEYRVTHLDATQGLTYARIRYTAGNDFRRAARQRILIQKLMEKAKSADVATLNKIMDRVLPYVATNIDKKKLLSMVQPIISYEIEDSVGFPFDHYDDDGKRSGLMSVVPVTLENNVAQLHAFLFDEQNYTPSDTVRAYSDYIINKTGLDESFTPEKSEDGELPWMSGEESKPDTVSLPEEEEES